MSLSIYLHHISLLQADDLIRQENLDKEYAGIVGIPEFAPASIKLALGADSEVIQSGRNVTVQSISGKVLAVQDV